MVLEPSQIPAIVAVMSAVTAAAAWLIRLQNVIDSKLSIQQHEDICQRTHAENLSILHEVRDLITQVDVKAREERHALRNELHLLALKVERIGSRVDAIGDIQKEDRP